MIVFSSANAPLYLKWACFGFLGGVLLHAMRPFDVFPVWIPLGAAMAGMLPFFFIRSVADAETENEDGKSRFMSYAIVMIACAIGIWRFEATIPSRHGDLPLGETVTMEGRIKDVRTYDDVVAVSKINSLPIRKAISVSFPRKGFYPRIGQYWRISCRLESYELAQEKTRVLNARKGIFYTCKGSVTGVKIRNASYWNVQVPLAEWRTVLTKRIMYFLPGDPGALLSGILYGERGLTKDASDSFRFAGMTHIIAVSGSNITIVVSVLVPALVMSGYRRKGAILISGAGILLFSLFAGASSSVVRAAIMGWLAILARVFGRRADVGHLLLLAAAVIVLFDPWALSFDAGFALSFLATWGLLVFARPAQQAFRFLPEMFGLREAFATTFSATLATAPYMMWQFRTFSFAGLVTNLFALPVVGLTMAWGVIGIGLGDITRLLVLPAEGCLRFMLYIADVSMRFPFLGIPYHMPFLLMASCYLVLCVIAYRIRPWKSYTQKRIRSSVKSK